MSNAELIGSYIEEELMPDITVYAIPNFWTPSDDVTVKIKGHPLSFWTRLRFRFGF